jgi:secreted PhoX family phosphatase
MNTVNESGKKAGRYLYRTHEVRSGAEYGTPPSGAVSVVDLETGESRILAQDSTYDALDGIRWTPWGTILFAEEITGGRLLEIVLDKQDPMTAAAVIDRPMLGRMAHEGIEVGPDGSLYVIDEFNGGSIYRFVPDRRGDLSSGQLYALRIQGISDTAQLWSNYNATTNPHTGAFEWVALDMAQVQIDSRTAADAVKAIEYGRPEDLEMIGQVLYVANTSEDRVLAIDLKGMTVTSFVEAGVNVPVENAGLQVTGFNNPDNLATSPNGDLVIIEDNVPSDIWFAGKDRDKDGYADHVYLFASLTDPGAEGTGIYFGKDPHTLFVNIQHSAAPDGDGTWAITNRKK